MSFVDKKVFVSGVKVCEKPLRTLQAGVLRVDYQSGFLRYIRIGELEVLRLVNFALRDHNWETIPFSIIGEVIEEGVDSFCIRYRALFKSPEIDYEAMVEINGDTSGRIAMRFEGRSHCDFRKNRIGFTVLHPLKEYVGQDLEAVHANGCVQQSHFPDLISPHQPLFDLSQLKWKVGEFEATLKFDGDVFEMEDQRNWTDASFKTYCTPLEKPYPQEVRIGDSVKQEVCLCVSGNSEQQGSIDDTSQIVSISKGHNWEPVPELGVGKSQEIAMLSTAECECLSKLGLSHYRVELDLSGSDWREVLDVADSESQAMGLPITFAIFLSHVEDLTELLEPLALLGRRVKSVLLLPKGRKVLPSDWIPVLAQRIRSSSPEVLIGAGTDAFFAELNRERVPTEELDFLSYSLNPQVHAFDNLSLVETFEAQGETVRTAQSFADGADIHISPVTFRMRWNPNATETEGDHAEGELARDVDLRQLSLFGAAWTMGSIASLGRAGATAISFYETVGERGVMQASQPVNPELFGPAPAGAVYPIYYVLKEFAEARSACYLDSSVPRAIVSLLVKKECSSRLLLANLRDYTVKVDLKEVFEPVSLSCMDANSWNESTGVGYGEDLPKCTFSQTLLDLPPYAFVVLEGSVK
ncbi:hypothetical protein [Pelagicoccus albus]|uniref:Uncharacterized protein n=1 Tax=Pelagicoccus albus TaxID=415222 RepID=A0A7X1B7Y2_9BACT|nr:hypothetical protein [Pelagicoccus albus]MBC2607059.1 hypothetical protein [Pelagicoccus albus]